MKRADAARVIVSPKTREKSNSREESLKVITLIAAIVIAPYHGTNANKISTPPNFASRLPDHEWQNRIP